MIKKISILISSLLLCLSLFLVNTYAYYNPNQYINDNAYISVRYRYYVYDSSNTLHLFVRTYNAFMRIGQYGFICDIDTTFKQYLEEANTSYPNYQRISPVNAYGGTYLQFGRTLLENNDILSFVYSINDSSSSSLEPLPYNDYISFYNTTFSGTPLSLNPIYQVDFNKENNDTYHYYNEYYYLNSAVSTNLIGREWLSIYLSCKDTFNRDITKYQYLQYILFESSDIIGVNGYVDKINQLQSDNTTLEIQNETLQNENAALQNDKNNLQNQVNSLLDQIQESGNIGFKGLFFAVASTPLYILQQLLSFEFLGVQFYYVLVGFITALLALWLVKKFM